MATALFAEYLSIQRPLQCIVPDKPATRQLALWGVSNFAQVTVLGGNLLDHAPFLADDLFQIIICHGVIVDSHLLRSR